MSYERGPSSSQAKWPEWNWPKRTAAGLLAVAALAGCAGGGEAGPSAASASAPVPTEASPSTTPSETVDLYELADKKFRDDIEGILPLLTDETIQDSSNNAPELLQEANLRFHQNTTEENQKDPDHWRLGKTYLNEFADPKAWEYTQDMITPESSAEEVVLLFSRQVAIALGSYPEDYGQTPEEEAHRREVVVGAMQAIIDPESRYMTKEAIMKNPRWGGDARCRFAMLVQNAVDSRLNEVDGRVQDSQVGYSDYNFRFTGAEWTEEPIKELSSGVVARKIQFWNKAPEIFSKNNPDRKDGWVGWVTFHKQPDGSYRTYIAVEGGVMAVA